MPRIMFGADSSLDLAVVPASRRGAVAAAARAIARGEVVAFPTESVYGLAVRPGDEAALRRLARLKRRGKGRPFQLLVSSERMARRLCGRWPTSAAVLARAFWPGPLTVVVRSADGRWLGLRVPDHPVALALLRRVGGVLVATSANLSGRRPARDAAGVLQAFEKGVALILDGGRASLGRASTVIRIGERGWSPLRSGAIPLSSIRTFIGPETHSLRRSR